MNFKKLILVSAMVTVTGSVCATPVINNSDMGVINIPENAGQWLPGEDANDIYIAPPPKGSVDFVNYVPLNETYCEDFDVARAAEKVTNQTYALLSLQVTRLQVEYGEFEYQLDDKGQIVFENGLPLYILDDEGNPVRTAFGLEIEAARKSLASSTTERTIADSIKLSAERSLFNARTMKNRGRDELKSCKDEANTEDENWREYCEDEYDEYQDIKSDYNDARDEFYEAEDDYLLADFQWRRDDSVKKELEERVEYNTDRISAAIVRVQAEKIRLGNLYSELTDIFGGQVNMSYNTNWDQLVQDFQRLNPSKNIRRVSLRDMHLTAPNSYSFGESPLGELTGVAWSTLNIANNVLRYDYVTLPDGTSQQIGLENSVNGWSDNFQGSFGVMLPNACKIQEGTEGLAGAALTEAYSQNFNAYISPSISYNYDVGADFGYKATYNLSSIMEVIERTSKRSGWFSSSSSHSLSENFDATQAFKMEYIKEAAGVPEYLTQDDKKALTDAVRSRIVKQALDAVAQRVSKGQPELPAVTAPVGGVVASRLVGLCQYGWGYRCGGGWLLYGVNGIIGNRTSAMSHYISTNDVEITEEVEDRFFVEFNGSIGFEGDQAL